MGGKRKEDEDEEEEFSSSSSEASESKSSSESGDDDHDELDVTTARRHEGSNALLAALLRYFCHECWHRPCVEWCRSGGG